MENSELLKVILTSSLIAGILSAIVSAIVSIKLKNIDYKNEYFKRILDKRLEAYKFIEIQIAILKSSILDDDAKSYHLIFAYGEDKFHEFKQNLFAALSYSMWINDNTLELMENLNDLFFTITNNIANPDEELLKKVGKENYHKITKLRISLENSVRDDLLNLHDLKNFKRTSNFTGGRIIGL